MIDYHHYQYGIITYHLLYNYQYIQQLTTVTYDGLPPVYYREDGNKPYRIVGETLNLFFDWTYQNSEVIFSLNG